MIPFLFSKGNIGIITNKDLHQAIKDVKATASQEEAIAKAFDIITTRFKGYRFETYLFFWKAFETDPNVLWEKPGFMHCTHQNFLLRILLIKSGWFTDDDISLGYSLVWYISLHQYLKVKLNNKQIALDPWNHRFGIPMGKYATGFGSKALLNDSILARTNS